MIWGTSPSHYRSGTSIRVTSFLSVERTDASKNGIPQANGMMERFHRQLKTVVKCHASSRWTQMLPTVLLDIRVAWRDLQVIVAELVYGETLRLPGQFLTQRPMENSDEGANFVKKLRPRFDDLRPIDGIRHKERHPFVFKDLKTADVRSTCIIDENVVANVLSKVEEIQSLLDYSALAASQETDVEEIRTARIRASV